MPNTRCNYCGQVVSFIEIRGNSTCPVCRQSSTSCCEGGSCHVVNTSPQAVEKMQADHTHVRQQEEQLHQATMH